MNKYKLLRPGDDIEAPGGDFYSNEDPNNIQNFISCIEGYGNKIHCTSFFKYKNIYVEYKAQEHLYYKQHNLKSAVIKLIKE